jgi:hypothetical protein
VTITVFKHPHNLWSTYYIHSDHPSVYAYETISEQLNGFSLNMILESHTKTCQHIQFWLKLDKK